jgi:hypothetical protein
MTEAPKSKFNTLVVIEIVVGFVVVIVGALWFASSMERRLSLVESRQEELLLAIKQLDARKDSSERDARVDRIENALREQSKMIQQLAPRK